MTCEWCFWRLEHFSFLIHCELRHLQLEGLGSCSCHIETKCSQRSQQYVHGRCRTDNRVSLTHLRAPPFSIMLTRLSPGQPGPALSAVHGQSAEMLICLWSPSARSFLNSCCGVLPPLHAELPNGCRSSWIQLTGSRCKGAKQRGETFAAAAGKSLSDYTSSGKSG